MSMLYNKKATLRDCYLPFLLHRPKPTAHNLNGLSNNRTETANQIKLAYESCIGYVNFICPIHLPYISQSQSFPPSVAFGGM